MDRQKIGKEIDQILELLRKEPDVFDFDESATNHLDKFCREHVKGRPITQNDIELGTAESDWDIIIDDRDELWAYETLKDEIYELRHELYPDEPYDDIFCPIDYP